MINNCNFWTSEIFFDRLNFFLNDRNWSLYQLCLSADISVDTLYKLRKHHRLSTLRTVCTYYAFRRTRIFHLYAISEITFRSILQNFISNLSLHYNFR